MSPHKFIHRKLKAMFRKVKRLAVSEDRDPNQHRPDDMLDLISNLPDSILHHILSFIPTKEVVKTSILCTRWKNLSTSVPNIDFDDGSMYVARKAEVPSFIKFVENVLKLRDASNMEKFRLSCSICNNASKIQSWISYAIMHNVHELDLSLFGEDPFVIPDSMFASTSLVSLKIRMDCVIELPSHISFPSLKTLHLSSVRFPHDDFTEKLISGCPVLEELSILDCDLVNMSNIVISSSTLKSLTIHDQSSFDDLDENDPSGCNINIDASNLTYFEYTGYLTNEILLNDPFSIVNACIEIPTLDDQVAFRAVNLLKQLQYVASLSVSNHIMEAIIFADNEVYLYPVFQNLSDLVLTMKSGDYPFGGLMDLLYFCPTLQSICVSEGFKHPMGVSHSDPIWLSTPICMSNRLKKLSFKNFHANDSEIYFLKCVLKYACVLERMDIGWSKTQLPGLKKQMQAMTELETIKRSSTTCVVMFT
ncbi:hypothetical protein LXL04_008988 [Taraxacum kok-saghyz]